MGSETGRMLLKFWGVRGSIPTPIRQNLGSGGNTTCLEVRLPSGEVLIVDAGTGVRALGASLAAAAQGKASHLHLFLTHFHWDHIHGLPYFQPLYSKENAVTFYSMMTPEETCEILGRQMSGPYFPWEFRQLPARLNFVAIPGKTFRFGDSEVKNFALNHPQGCHGYSFTHGGRKLVFASDLEHGDPEFDRILLAAARGADVLIYDAQYTPEEYAGRRGWGHSTWLQATEVARQTGAKKLFLFHHDPGHSDAAMQAILSEARTHFAETYLAIEGESLTI
jgi:phosphoribosyl 1,2-cyclic phosphodiesterase